MTINPTLPCSFRRGLLAFSGLILLAAPALADSTYYVAPPPLGQDAAGRGTAASTPFATLSYACNAAGAGVSGDRKIIQLAAGNYQETTTTTARSYLTIRGSTTGTRSKVIAPTNAIWNNYTQKPAIYNTTSIWNPNINGIEGYIIIGNNAASFHVENVDFDGHATYDGDPATTVKPPDWDGWWRGARGAIALRASHNVVISGCAITNFQLAGLFHRQCDSLTITGCQFFNSALDYNKLSTISMSNQRYFSSMFGQVTLEYATDLTLSGNEFHTTVARGYGYRGRGHTRGNVSGNLFRINSSAGAFNIEVAHTGDKGLQIHNNDFDGAVSLVKPTAANPSPIAYYTVRVHNNVFKANFAVEGPMAYLEVDHNHFYGDTRYPGRTYTNFGPDGNGPTWIHHNVAENTDTSFVFSQGGEQNLWVYNNTVQLNTYSADAAFKLSSGDIYTVKNNVIIAPPAYTKLVRGTLTYIGKLTANTTATDYEIDARLSDSQSDPLLRHPDNSKVLIFTVPVAGTTKTTINRPFRANLAPSGTKTTNNMVWNCSAASIPAGNITADPAIKGSGVKPTEFYAPASASSNLVGAGAALDVPLTAGGTTYLPRNYTTATPDLGAVPWFGGTLANGSFGAAYTGSTVPSWTENNDVAASYVSNVAEDHTTGVIGGQYLVHYSSNATYNVTTSQTRTGLGSSGLKYALRAWVWVDSALGTTGGNQSVLEMRASGHGSADLVYDIPRGKYSAWLPIVIPDIPVTTGTCTISFKSTATTKEWMRVDDVEFFRQ